MKTKYIYIALFVTCAFFPSFAKHTLNIAVDTTHNVTMAVMGSFSQAVAGAK